MTFVTEQNLTDLAIERWSNIPDPRLRQIMMSLVKHLHAFVRDVEPNQQEWFAAIEWLTGELVRLGRTAIKFNGARTKPMSNSAPGARRGSAELLSRMWSLVVGRA